MTNQFVSTSEKREGKTQTSSRRFFLRTSVVGASILAPAGLLTACGISNNVATTSMNATNTVSAPVNNTTTTLALKSITDSKAAFTEIMSDENEHVTFLKDALTKAGAAPRVKPTFKDLQQTDITAFANLAQTFENVGVGTYLMAASAISHKAYLAAAGSILTVEARHAGYLNALLEKPLNVNGAFDKPLTQAEIVTAVSPFIANLNGGSNPSAPLKNDVDILNFALLLELSLIHI